MALLLAGPAAGQEPERGSDEHVRAIMQRALDDALHDQVRQLFTSWMKDATGQPHRASVGIRRSVAAYRHALHAIQTEKLTWKQQRLVRR
ncbi:MAG TPA: hypothetical protein VF748_00785 [Candidatus Acidoferrum sp.]